MTMAGFVGADIDQLTALAGAFERRSDAFNRIAGAANSALMVAEWTGADVDRVRSEWNSQARPAIQRVASELSALAVELRRQAEQQREASGGAVPGGIVGMLPWLPDWFGPRFGPGIPPWLLPEWTDPRLPDFGDPGFTLPRLPDLFDRVPGLVSDIWGRLGEGIDSNIPGIPWSWGDVGQFVPIADDALNIRDYVDRISQGEVPVHEIIGDIGGAMRSEGVHRVNPALYLGGAAVGIWDDVIEQAQQTDWSKSTFDNAMNFIANDPAEALDAAGDAIVDFFPDLISNFKFW
jgi:hypothetical protein